MITLQPVALLLAVVSAVGAGFTAVPAAAAPQVLGLVASATPTPLTCGPGGCHAELSSFCLQQPRANPSPDTAYLPAAGADIFLVGTDLEGAAVKIPAAAYLRFAVARGFTAVDVELPAEILSDLGLTHAAIVIGEDVSLVPAGEAGGPNPQTADEIATAVGPIRAAAEEFFDTSGEASDAIRATSAMINALPAAGRSPLDSDGHLLAATGAASAAHPAGASLARSFHAACVTKVDVTHHVFSMRDCLESSHDRLVTKTNIQFWESLGGS